MGLDVSHDCWRGAYSAFSRWRAKLAELAGIPLELMEGYYDPDAASFNGPPNPSAMEWAAPRTGGPLCKSHYGPALHAWITKVARWLPISWDVLWGDALILLLDHSDCDGIIAAGDCARLADRLEDLMPLLENTPDDDGHIGNWAAKTRKFIDGLRLAASKGENVEFS